MTAMVRAASVLSGGLLSGCSLVFGFSGYTGGSALDVADASRDGAVTLPDASRFSDASRDASGDAGFAPVYLGCFEDSPQRDLPNQVYDGPDNTPASCEATCTGMGYAYAGVQFGSQCFCGDSYGGQGPSDSCNAQCTGDSFAVCGGTYTNGIYGLHPQAPIDPVGCYNDKAPPAPRDLPVQGYTSDFNSTEACVAYCTYHGYLYAGTQVGTDCWCGNRYGKYGPSKECIDGCSGTMGEICGGSSENSIYRTPVAEAGPDDAGVDGGTDDAGTD